MSGLDLLRRPRGGKISQTLTRTKNTTVGGMFVKWLMSPWMLICSHVHKQNSPRHSHPEPIVQLSPI